jgi:endonuclease III
MVRYNFLVGAREKSVGGGMARGKGNERAGGAIAETVAGETTPRIARILAILDATYGPKVWSPDGDPLGGLIGTILSQATSDINSGRAYAALRATFPTWEAVLAAPEEAVADAIRSGGLANLKARRIQETLGAILAARGALDLDFLTDLPLAEARTWLTGLPGVGPKTAACVLLFNLGRPALPVDTHVHRVSRRLGLIGARVGAGAAHDALQAQVAPARVYDFHVNLIWHGRRICHAQRPRCEVCPLAGVCAYYRAMSDE